MGVRIVSGIMLPMFLMSIAVQYNDPDGWVWMLIYAFPALLAILGLMNEVSVAAIPMSAIFTVGAAILMPWNELGLFGEYVSQWHMKNSNAEYMREALGLFVCVAYFDFLTVVYFLRRRTAAAQPDGVA